MAAGCNVFSSLKFLFTLVSIFVLISSWSLQSHNTSCLSSQDLFIPKTVVKRAVYKQCSSGSPVTKLGKHGFQCLSIDIGKQILLKCRDISLNPGPFPSSLRCFLQNARNLKAVRADGNTYETKTSILQDIAYGDDLDIVCLTETWLNESIGDAEVLPVGYNVYRKDRLNRIGGGTLTAVKDSLCSNQFELPDDLSSLETVLVEVDHLHNQRKILILNCYRPPNDCEFISKFKILINWRLQLRDYYSVIVLGDFNYPGIRWIEGSGFTNCLSGEEHSFVNLLTANYFFQLVETPTRINNILDLLITKHSIGYFVSRDWSTFKRLWSSI